MDFVPARQRRGDDYDTIVTTKYRVVWIDNSGPVPVHHKTEELHAGMGGAILYAESVLSQVRLAFAPRPVRCSYFIQPVQVYSLGTKWN